MVRLYRGWGSTGDIAFIKIIDVYEKNGILIESSKDAITVSYRRPAGKY